jgi:hypothetical protein
VSTGVVEVGALLRVVAPRVVDGADVEGEVVSGLVVWVGVDEVVAVTEEVGSGRVPAGAEPPWAPSLLGLPAGGGRTWR